MTSASSCAGITIATVGRLLIVLTILVPFALSGLREKLPRLTSRDWKVLAALGFTGGGLHLALQWLGLHYTTATSGVLYLSTSPVFILLMAAPLAGERIVLRQWLGVVASFCGVAIIATRGNFNDITFNIGDLMALATHDVELVAAEHAHVRLAACLVILEEHRVRRQT